MENKKFTLPVKDDYQKLVNVKKEIGNLLAQIETIQEKINGTLEKELNTFVKSRLERVEAIAREIKKQIGGKNPYKEEQDMQNWEKEQAYLKGRYDGIQNGIELILKI